MTMITNFRLHARMATLLALCIALAITCGAQNKPAEKEKGKKDNSEAAWKMQAQSVAEEIGLSRDQTAKLTAAYLVAQKDHKLALKKLPQEKDKGKSRAA